MPQGNRQMTKAATTFEPVSQALGLIGDTCPQEAAVFLGLDGVLLAAGQAGKDLNPGIPDLLAALTQATGEATALVSDRSDADLRGWIPASWHQMTSGNIAHLSGERRLLRSPVQIGSEEVAQIHAAAGAMELFSDSLVIDRNAAGVTVQFEAAPEEEPRLRTALGAVAKAHPAFELHASSHALGLRPRRADACQHLRNLMALPPFRGRVPVYFGREDKDEAALSWVTAQGGVAVKVGPGATCAPQRVDGPRDVHAVLWHWLEGVAQARDFGAGARHGIRQDG